MSEGRVYIAVCDKHPGIVKVGETTKEVWVRERGLGGAACLESWTIVAAFDTPNSEYTEMLAHARLEAAGAIRLNEKREHFVIDFETALTICEDSASRTLSPREQSQKEKPQPVSHSNPLWQQLLRTKVVGNFTLASLIADATFGRNTAVSKLRKLGLECVRFDRTNPTFQLDTEAAEESRLGKWLYTHGHNIAKLLEFDGQNTVRFTLSAV
jgi:hypothetical protein